MDWIAPQPVRRPALAHAASLGLLLLPAVVLGIAAERYQSPLLLAGAIAELLAGCLFLRTREVWNPPASGSLILLYLMALGWLWFVSQGMNDPFVRAARGLFILVALILFAMHDLIRTGVEPRRRARRLTGRLLTRASWPETLPEFARIPEIEELQSVVRDDPTLVLILLDDRRPDVQLAGLSALQGRPYWRWDEAGALLKMARTTTVPEVKISVLHALGTADNADVMQGVVEFLKDPSKDVRKAASESLLMGGERRWALVRGAIRNLLADPAFLTDGSLPGSAGKLAAVAVCDLTGWATEPGPISERAVRTLLDHYHLTLQRADHPGLPAELGRQITDEHSPPILRVELAHLLHQHGMIPDDLLDRMTDADQPGPVRLLAADIVLKSDPTDGSALDVLRGLGRQSNRDTALAIARILHNRLQLDLGLPGSGVVPSSKQSADVTQKVFRWATGRGPTAGLDETPVSLDESLLGSMVFGPGGILPYETPTGPTSAPGVSPTNRYAARR